MNAIEINYSATVIKSTRTHSYHLTVVESTEKEVIDLIRVSEVDTAAEHLHGILTNSDEWVEETIQSRDEDNLVKDFTVKPDSCDITVKTVFKDVALETARLHIKDNTVSTVPEQLLVWISADSSEFEHIKGFQTACRNALLEEFVSETDDEE